jgi:hypothetical protein
MTPNSADLRPRTYAAAELFLDLLHAVRTLADIDLDSIAIYICVAEATMRPVVANPDRVRELEGVKVAPEDIRGSITMLLVSDRLGLARETVRRKVKHMIEAGLLYQDDRGRVRSAPTLGDPKLLGAIGNIEEAVRRYHARLAMHGIKD